MGRISDVIIDLSFLQQHTVSKVPLQPYSVSKHSVHVNPLTDGAAYTRVFIFIGTLSTIF